MEVVGRYLAFPKTSPDNGYDASVSDNRHRHVYQNEPFREEVRFSDDVTDIAYVLVDGRMRAVMPLTDGVFDPENGVDTELFDVTPTQDVAGWVTGLVPEATIALCPVGVGRYDMVLEYADQDRERVSGGTLEVREGIS